MNAAQAWLARHRVDLALALGIGMVALILRAPSLYTIPRFTDEVLEWQFALDIARGVRSPFVGLAPYLGPFGSALLALALGVYASPYTPRALASVMGALTAPATFALGNVTGGRRAGTIAGLLLATAGTHIVVNSHIAYVNSLTPLGTAVTLTLFYVACERAAGRWLIAAGVAFGLTLQTHPVAIALAPGMALWFLAARRQWAWFRRPTLYGAIGAAALAYSPVLAVLLTQSSRARTQIITRSYAFAIPHSPGEYFVNLQGLMVELARMLGAVFPNLDAPRQYLVQPLVCAYLALTVLALWAMLRLHKSYLVCIIGSVVLLVPLFNRQYGDFPYFTRYIALLLPPIYAAVGLGLDRLWTTLAARPTERWWRWVVTGLFLLGVSWLALEPLRLTAEFYVGQVRGGRTNTLLLDVTRQIAQAPERPIFLDDGLAAGEFPSGGNVLMSLQGWFDLAGIPWMPTSEGRRFACGQDAWLIATAEAASRVTLRVTNCRAERITGAVIPTRPGRAPLELGLYHLQAAP